MNPIMPRPLTPGDRVAILSPASIIKKELVDGAVDTLKQWGYQPVVMPHTLGMYGTYSGSVEERLDDLTSAISDPSIRAIICSRGGYGAVHLLDSLDRLPLADDPKWIVGFSDISAIHALMAKHGIVSIHSSMAKGLTRGPLDPLNLLLKGMLEGERPDVNSCDIQATNHPFNRPGLGTGTLRGGNLAVLDGLVGTPFNDFAPGCILVIEDIAEPIYKIERMLYRLKLSGLLDNLSGLIVGRFTEYRPDANHDDMESMINAMLRDVNYPVVFNAPIGHIDHNLPWLHNAPATLAVSPTSWSLKY